MSYFLTTNKVKLFYEYSPQKNKLVLVFVHGLAGQSSYWQSYWNYFKCNYGLLRFDLRGHGKSETAESYQVEDFSQDLKQLIETLKINEYYLITFSLGSLTAADFVERYEPKIKGIVMVSPLAGYDDFKTSFLLKVKLTGLFPKAGFKFLNQKKLYLGSTVLKTYLQSLSKTDSRAIFKILKGLKNYGWIKRVKCRNLIFTADNDQIIKNHIKDVYSNIIKLKGDHLAIFNQQKRIIKEMEKFFEKAR